MYNCRQGFVCPTAGSFTMNVDVSGYVTMWNPHTFPGTPPPGIVQVVINLRAGGTANYIVTESGILFRHTEHKRCTFTNQYRIASIPTS
ncbi:MAG: hypothetical protein WBP83_07030 [Nitrososphaeraceae archaeon]